MASSRARVRVFSDDGFCVFDPLIMRRALEYVKAFERVVVAPARAGPPLDRGRPDERGLRVGRARPDGWPAVAEESIIARDVLLAEHVGSRLHVCHLSTAGSVDIIRWAKKRGVNVTAEVTPHHLLLTEELVRGYDARYKVNPPLRATRTCKRCAKASRTHDRSSSRRPRAASGGGGEVVRVAGGGQRHGRAGIRPARRAPGDGADGDAVLGTTWPA